MFPKLFWPSVRKNSSSDREKLLKFKAKSLELATILRSLVKFIWILKGQNNFVVRNMQEKSEKKMCWSNFWGQYIFHELVFLQDSTESYYRIDLNPLFVSDEIAKPKGIGQWGHSIYIRTVRSQLFNVVVHLFPSWLVLGRNQVCCAC